MGVDDAGVTSIAFQVRASMGCTPLVAVAAITWSLDILESLELDWRICRFDGDGFGNPTTRLGM